MRPTPIDRELGAGREGRIEREEENGLGDFLRLPEARHGDHTARMSPDLGGRIFVGERLFEDARVDGTGRHRVHANIPRKKLSGRHPGE